MRASAVGFTVTLAASLVTAGPAATASAAEPCPPAFPTAGLTAGQVLSGLTVERGEVPDEFAATVVGVIDNGIAPGIDMIVADATSPAVERAGGIWAGMSGSPVYAEDGRLVGAVAYGLSFGPSSVAGITPAEDMQILLSGGLPAQAAPEVDLPADLQRALVRSGLATTQEAAGGLAALPTPVGVSGLSGQRLTAVADRLQARVPGARLLSAGGVSATAQPGTPLVAGGNVASALSYGDLTAAGVGTVTAVCGQEALLFGHPMTFLGRTSMSAHSATALYVQRETIGAPFKVANPGGVVGTVDEDRLVGLRAALGDAPPTTPVTSAVVAPDTGRARNGTTQVVEPTFVPDGVALHALSNLDRVADRIGGGVVTLDWTASGTRADGSQWSLQRHDRVADTFDVTFPAAFGLYDLVGALTSNRFEDITVGAVSLDASVTATYADAVVVGLQVRGQDGVFRTPSETSPAQVTAGSRAIVRVTMRPYRSATTRSVDVAVSVPPGWAGATGSLLVTGGGSVFDEEGPQVSSFPELVAALASAPSGDSVVATLDLEREGPTGFQVIQRRGQTVTDTVVLGELGVPVEVVAPRAARIGTVQSGRLWTLRSSLSAGPVTNQLNWGSSGDLAVMGDWDGNGTATPGLFRNGTWFLRDSLAASAATRTVSYGRSGDVPVVGDWDGDGDTDLGVRRSNVFYLRDSSTSGVATTTFAFGAGTDRPVAGDWDGDGRDSIGVFRAGAWFARDPLTAGPATRTATYGTTGDRPATGDWNRDGRTDIGVYRTGLWFLRSSFSTGSSTASFRFGDPGGSPVVWR